ncbi:MAG: anthranilate synthase component I family protein [Alphaproteobacteria bacterium]|nr:anthranilate synthase component I family protein [Alphaproteobacteria bacterium]
MNYKKQLEWQDPVEIAAKFADKKCMAFLHSGLKTNFSGNKSLLAVYPNKFLIPDSFEDLNKLEQDYYFGFIEYEFPETNFNTIFYSFHVVLIFDHETKTIELNASDEEHYNNFIKRLKVDIEPPKNSKIFRIFSHFKKDEYLKCVDIIRNNIIDGEVYQANFTNKFYGRFDSLNAFDLYKKLLTASPSVYSCYIKFDDKYVISSSPEQFVKMDKDGNCETRPIKGTARRSNDPSEDDRIKEILAGCEKNRAENLMLTDLMRNDFNRVCDAGSVLVPKLFEISTYSHLHHMSSTIIGKLASDDRFKLLSCSFPPGSMTGAPKLAAISILKDIEMIPRGIYSGIIGYFAPDKSFEFSVAIRTLLINEGNFEFQVGGGITIDSAANDEFEEMITKSLGIIKALGITEEEIRKVVG